MQTPTKAFAIKEKLANLEAALDAQLPGIATILKDIHGVLKADPDNVTLMTEEDIAIVVRGLKKQTATEITTTALKSGSKKKLNSITTADL